MRENDIFTFCRLRWHLRQKICFQIYVTVPNVIVEFNNLSKSGPWSEIRQSYLEIFQFYCCNSDQNAISWKNRKIQKFRTWSFYIIRLRFLSFYIIFSQKMLKKLHIFKFWIFRFFHEFVFWPELQQKNWNISRCSWRILDQRPDLEWLLNSTILLGTVEYHFLSYKCVDKKFKL